jgi:hypothetical protein
MAVDGGGSGGRDDGAGEFGIKAGMGLGRAAPFRALSLGSWRRLIRKSLGGRGVEGILRGWGSCRRRRFCRLGAAAGAAVAGAG